MSLTPSYFHSQTKTETICIPPKAVGHMLKTKKDLETPHSVRIFVNKCESRVSIHGLQNNITMCRQAVEESLYIIKKVNIACYMGLYLETKWLIKIEEYRKRCEKISMPPPSQSDNLSMNCFILVKGKSSDVESVCNDMEKRFDNFHWKNL